MDKKSWLLAKHYTDETAAQFGGLKGANCKITSVIKKNGQNIITFEWKNDDGETRETKVYVDDGTPIYSYTPGYTYKYGDLAIYESAFYRCIVEECVATPVIDETKWNEIGSPDGSYDIVQDSSQLPPRFTSADRKMYYSIADNSFWLWTGSEWELQERSITNAEIDALFI